MNIKSIFKSVKKTTSKNAPEILIGFGIAGLFISGITAVKATPKALQLIEEAEKEKNDKLTKKEIVMSTWKEYIPSIIIGTLTISSIICQEILNKKQRNCLLSAYTVLQQSYRELDQSYKSYKNKLKELYGEDAHEKIMNALAIEKCEKIYISNEYLGSNDCLLLDEETAHKVLFYDENSERFFKATIEQVMDAEYHINRNYVLAGSVCLNDFYAFLGLDPVEKGDILEWEILDEGMYWIEFNHRKAYLEDNTPYYVIETPYAPFIPEEYE